MVREALSKRLMFGLITSNKDWSRKKNISYTSPREGNRLFSLKTEDQGGSNAVNVIEFEKTFQSRKERITCILKKTVMIAELF